jgi:DNA-binding CsgD family transcriptional regulator
VSIFFGPDQRAALEKMASDLLSGKVPLTEKTTMIVDGQQLNAVVTPFETSKGPVTVLFLSPLPDRPTIDLLRRRFLLTQKEAEVAMLLCEGRSNKEVARCLHFKVSTAEKHTENVLSKMGVSSRKDIQPAVMKRIDEAA